MITMNLNLAKFEHFVKEFKNKEGGSEECIIIPIKRNSLVKTDKGNVFCNAKMVFIKPEKRKGDDTHMIVQSFGKEKDKAMQDTGERAPILGNARDWYEGGQSEQANTTTDFSSEPEPGDDLPF